MITLASAIRPAERDPLPVNGLDREKSGHSQLPAELRSYLPHTHHALDDARSQAEIFAKLMGRDLSMAEGGPIALPAALEKSREHTQHVVQRLEGALTRGLGPQ